MNDLPVAAPVRIDARGMRCPWPVLRAAKAMRTHPAIEISADDPIAEAELAALAQQRGWRFEQSEPGTFRLAASGAHQPGNGNFTTSG